MKYEIGFKFKRRGYYKVIETVIDIHTTLSANGGVFKVRYVTHRVLATSNLKCDYTDYDVTRAIIDNSEHI